MIACVGCGRYFLVERIDGLLPIKGGCPECGATFAPVELPRADDEARPLPAALESQAV